MRHIWINALFGLAVAFPATAQEAKPPLLVVKPSGVDDTTDEAKAREDRLYRRMQQNDYLFRNICVHCGGGINRAGANAPFNPIKALSGSHRSGFEPAEPESAE